MILSPDIAVAKFAQLLDLAPGKVVEKITADLWNKITLRTPVDTGRARASWQLSQGSPDTSVASEMEGQGGQGATPMPSLNIDGTQVVYITNSLPYIEALEDGSSQQAPAGMVAVSIAEVKAEIELTIESLEKLP